MKKFKLLGIVLLLIAVTIGFGINYVFFEPTQINAYIAAKVYKSPANSYFNDNNFYKLVVDAYNEQNGTSLGYTTNLSDEQLGNIDYLNIRCELVYDEIGGVCSDETVINDLTGLEKLTSLIYLTIFEMPFETVDISSLVSLTNLTVAYTRIRELDLSNNTELKVLSLFVNEIETLDVSTNVNLSYLDVSDNNLTSIDVSHNTNLESLDISDNNLISSLDVTKNIKLQSLSAANTKISGIDVTKNTDLRQLKLGEEKMYGVGCSVEGCNLPTYESYITSLDLSNNKLLEELYIDNAPIQMLDLSANTKLQLLSMTSADLISLDLTKNTELTSLYASLSKLKSINLGNAPIENLDLSLTKLSSLVLNEYQNQLSYLNISGITIQTLDVSKFTNLKVLELCGTDLKSLDISKNVALESLSIGKRLNDSRGYVEGNFAVTDINLEKNVVLESIFICDSDIETLDISKNVNLRDVFIDNTPIRELNLDYNAKISDLSISGTEIENLSLTNIEAIRMVDISYTPLNSLEFGNVSQLYGIALKHTNIKELDLSSIPDLIWVNFSENDFGEELYVYKGEEVFVNNTVKLPEYYPVSDIKWTSEDTNKATVDKDGLVETKSSGIVNISGFVQEYDDYYQEYYDVYTTTSVVNIVEITSDKYVIDDDNSLITITDNDVDIIKSNINVSAGITLDIDLGNNKLYVKHDEDVLKEFKLKTNNVFVDENFYKCVVDAYNTTNKTSIPYTYNLNNEELETITELNCSSRGIVDISGIEMLKKLGILNLSNKQIPSNGEVDNRINEIDLSSNVLLVNLWASRIQLEKLNVSKNSNLINLHVFSNKLTEIDLTNNNNLRNLDLSNNQLTEIDLSQNTSLNQLLIQNNKLTNLNLSSNKNITYLDVSSNNLKKLDLTNNTKVESIYLNGNPFGYSVAVYTGNTFDFGTDYGAVKFPLGFTTKYNSMTDNNSYLKIEGTILTNPDNVSGLQFVRYDYTNGSNSGFYQLTYGMYTIKISSNNYLINEENKFIYSGINNINIEKIKINTTKDWLELPEDHNIYLEVVKDKLHVKQENHFLEKFNILSLDLGNLKILNKGIVISEEIEYNNFVSNITLSEGLSYKILNESSEVTGSKITEGMILKIYYGNTEVDSFDITEEYVYIDEKLDVDENNNYLSNIETGTKASDIINMIDTSGIVTIINNKNEVITGDKLIGTGTKISVKLKAITIEYKVMINGDIDGDGKLQLGDIMKLANYLYKDKNSLKDVYLLAADYDENGIQHLQDIMKIANKLYGGGN